MLRTCHLWAVAAAGESCPALYGSHQQLVRALERNLSARTKDTGAVS